MSNAQGQRKKGLAVVRCGDASLHNQWAQKTQSFDVAVSYFGNDAEKKFPEARYVHRLKAGKWDGIYAFFQAYPELCAAYDYYWFPDDDLALSAETADAMLALGESKGLDLFQIALDRNSYFTHLLTLQITGNHLRTTNFIEIMAPILSRRLFQRALPGFANTRTGFGLDFLWPQMVEDLRGGDRYGCAIIDSLTMTHTRPIGSALKALVASDGGRSGRDELREVLGHVRRRNPLFRSLKMAVPRKRVYMSETTSGRKRCGLMQILPMARALLRFDNQVQPLRRFRALLLAVTASL